MRFCVGEEPECNGPYCGHAKGCPFYKESMSEDDECRRERRRGKRKASAVRSSWRVEKAALPDPDTI